MTEVPYVEMEDILKELGLKVKGGWEARPQDNGGMTGEERGRPGGREARLQRC